jgi:hypothetical protein
MRVGHIDKETKTAHVSFGPIGPSGRLYKNRYYIPKYGSVIDLVERKFIETADYDSFIERIGDTVIFYRNNIYTGKGYLALDLITHNYDFIKEKTWYTARHNRESPDRKHYLRFDNSKLPYRLWLNNSDGEERLVVSDAKSGPQNISDAQFPNVETHWLNNHSFLYVIHHRQRNAQNRIYHKVDLREYDLRDDSDELFFSLDSIPQGMLNGRFTHDGIGQTLYIASSGKYYLLDTADHKLREYKEFQEGHGFSFTHPNHDRAIKYKGQPIGTIWCLPPVVSTKAAAVEYGDHGSNLGYPKGIKIWTAQQNEWLTFDLPWVNSIVGWIEEEQ